MMKKVVAVVGLEAGLQATMEWLLAREPDLTLTSLENSDPDLRVDTLIVSPPNPEWLERLRSRYPEARLVAMIGRNRRHHFLESSIDHYLDESLRYAGLLDLLRAPARSDIKA